MAVMVNCLELCLVLVLVLQMGLLTVRHLVLLSVVDLAIRLAHVLVHVMGLHLVHA